MQCWILRSTISTVDNRIWGGIALKHVWCVVSYRAVSWVVVHTQYFLSSSIKRNLDLSDPVILDTTQSCYYQCLSIVLGMVGLGIDEPLVSDDTVHHLVVAIIVVLFPSPHLSIILVTHSAGNQDMLHHWHSHRKNKGLWDIHSLYHTKLQGSIYVDCQHDVPN